MQTTWKSSFNVLMNSCYFLNPATHYEHCGQTKKGYKNNNDPCPFGVGGKLLQLEYRCVNFIGIRIKNKYVYFGI